VSFEGAAGSCWFVSGLRVFIAASDKVEKRDAADELIFDSKHRCEARRRNTLRKPLGRGANRFAAFRSTYNLNNQLERLFNVYRENKSAEELPFAWYKLATSCVHEWHLSHRI
jgi:hypothetical protein